MSLPSLLLLAVLAVGRTPDEGPAALRQDTAPRPAWLPARAAAGGLDRLDAAEVTLGEEGEEEALPCRTGFVIEGSGPPSYLGDPGPARLRGSTGHRSRPLRGPPQAA